LSLFVIGALISNTNENLLQTHQIPHEILVDKIYQEDEREAITDLVQVLIELPKPNRPSHMNYEVPPRTILHQTTTMKNKSNEPIFFALKSKT